MYIKKRELADFSVFSLFLLEFLVLYFAFEWQGFAKQKSLVCTAYLYDKAR